MPNHVTNKLIFTAPNATEIVEAICTNGCIDFEKLVPSPPHVYRGSLSAVDEEDFPCNWKSWNCENWGTKWNAYSGNVEQDHYATVLTFDTAWSPPRPIMSAFANRFGIPFEHRYFDEGENFWGVDTWGSPSHGRPDSKPDGPICRIKKRDKVDADYVSLCLELKGYDPTREE